MCVAHRALQEAFESWVLWRRHPTGSSSGSCAVQPGLLLLLEPCGQNTWLRGCRTASSEGPAAQASLPQAFQPQRLLLQEPCLPASSQLFCLLPTSGVCKPAASLDPSALREAGASGAPHRLIRGPESHRKRETAEQQPLASVKASAPNRCCTRATRSH